MTNQSHTSDLLPRREPLLRVRARSRSGKGSGGQILVARDLDPGRLAVVICDMWDALNCVSATRRVKAMAPHMDAVVARLRKLGALVIHAPSGCMDFYGGTPQRRRARQAPHAEAAAVFDWNEWDADREMALPEALANGVPCSCDTPELCCEAGPPYPWTRQIETLTLAPQDAITDEGQEVFNLLEQGGIDDVLVVGVHTNRCVLSRPFGIRQLVYVGKRPLLCRDLTDSFHRDPRGHSWGTETTIAHIERYWCPTVTSDQLVGGVPFAFAAEG